MLDAFLYQFQIPQMHNRVKHLLLQKQTKCERILPPIICSQIFKKYYIFFL